MASRGDLLQPEVINALGPYFWTLVFLVVIVVATAGLAFRALLRAGHELQHSWQDFIGNHMSSNVEINRQVEQSLGHLAERLASVETRVSECPARGKGDPP
jgi:hypothetical protein